ncbi:type I methionyl aminopeptidase [Taylorella equigenitalis]|uniref:type I methionyl aminopeptidase n=1 Tax=Taylorella equigenitalis TaxID=29575 RepID=UPI00237C6117|nr:type I methionyl aminopeptidase [Taylorella equigenitalis]WDU54144.1 type I methionyl aminopeptidase [Taylorella equigenitalis]
MQIFLDPTEISAMKAACEDAAKVLDFLTPHVKEGVTTAYLDKITIEFLNDVLHVKSATIGYGPKGHPPFPSSICTSINHVVCHGIPNDKPLKDGDIMNIDVTITKDGYFGDTSRMFLIGEPSVRAKVLSETAFEAMWLGISKVKPGARLGDIGHAIQTYAQKKGFSVVRDYCGHGVGKVFHDDPMVLHYGKAGTGIELFEGLTFTIEPMINAGAYPCKVLSDGWTVVTKDRSLSAQWEHTLRVTSDGYEVLTLSDGVRPPPAFINS